MQQGGDLLPDGLEVAEAGADRPLQFRERVEQPVVSRPPPQFLPETLDRVQLRAVAGQAFELQVRVLRQRLVDRPAPVPRRVVEKQHHLLVSVLRVDTPHVPQVVGERLLHPPRLALARLLPGVFGALQRVAVQSRAGQVDHGEDVKQVLVVARAHHRPVPLDAQRRPERRHHRETRLVLAQQHYLAGLGFFFSAAMSCRAWACLPGSPRSWW